MKDRETDGPLAASPNRPLYLTLNPGFGRLTLTVELQPTDQEPPVATDEETSPAEGTFPTELLEQIRKRRAGVPVQVDGESRDGYDIYAARSDSRTFPVNPWQERTASLGLTTSPQSDGGDRESRPGQRIVITVQQPAMLPTTEILIEEEQTPGGEMTVEEKPAQATGLEEVLAQEEPAPSPVEETLLQEEPAPTIELEEAPPQEEPAPSLVVSDQDFAARLKAEVLAEMGIPDESGTVLMVVTGEPEDTVALAQEEQESLVEEEDMSKKSRHHPREESQEEEAVEKVVEEVATAPAEAVDAIPEEVEEEAILPENTGQTIVAQAMAEAVEKVARLAEQKVHTATTMASELSDLLREMQPEKTLGKRLAAQAETAPAAAGRVVPLPIIPHQVTTPTLAAKRQVPVESLGDGVAHLLGDAVGGVVQGGKTVGGWLGFKKKGKLVTNGRVPTYPRAEMSLMANPSRTVPVEALAPGVAHLLGDAVDGVVRAEPVNVTKKAIARSSSAVTSGLQAVMGGVGQIVKGGAGVVTGVLGCLTGAVVCMGKAVVGGFQTDHPRRPTTVNHSDMTGHGI